MEFPLSRKEKKLLKEIEQKFQNHNPMMVDDETEFLECQELITLLIGQGFIKANNVCYRSIDGSVRTKRGFLLETDFDTIKSWIKNQEHKAKRSSKREWKIAIFSAICSAITGLIIGILTSDMILKFVADLLK